MNRSLISPSPTQAPLRPWLLRAAAVLAGSLPLAGASARAEELCFAPTPYTVGSQPSSVALADLDGDGLQDMVVANHAHIDENRVSVLHNNGDGTFAAGVFYDVGLRPYWLAVDDLDGDLDADVAVSNYWGHSISVLLNNGDGTLAPQTEYATGAFPTFLALARIDADTALDLVVAASNDDTGEVLFNNGDGTFASPVSYPVGAVPYGVAADDLDQDGDADLVFANFGGDGLGPTVSVLPNQGDGTFGSQVTYSVAPGALGVAAGDVDGDGFSDLVVAGNGFTAGTTLSLLLNLGDGTFGAYQPLAVGTGPYSVALADFDGDGWRDIVSANESDDTLSILFNTGAGVFATAVQVPVGFVPLAVALGDLDASGSQEIAVACNSGDEVWVLFNEHVGIVAHPVDTVATLRATAGFTVAAGGPGPLTYQWRKDGAPLSDGPSGTGALLSGTSTSSLTILGVRNGDAGAYDVVVTNDCGSVASNSATLAVEIPAEPRARRSYP